MLLVHVNIIIYSLIFLCRQRSKTDNEKTLNDLYRSHDAKKRAMTKQMLQAYKVLSASCIFTIQTEIA